MISSYVHNGFHETSLQLFYEMLNSGEKPNQFTFSVTIRTCTNLKFLQMGMQIHGLIIGFGFERDEFAGSSLVDMYFKVGDSLEKACNIFDGLYNRDSVTWNVMISGFAQVGDYDKVLRLFSDMQVIDGLSPNDFTFTSLLKCCCWLMDVEQIHGLVLKCGAEVDVVVGSALVDLYGKCGNVDSSRKILDSMGVKDSFVWSSIISSYSRNGCGEEAVLLFTHMCRQGVKLDQYALSSSLKACVGIGGIVTGIQIHTQVIKNGYQRDCFVASVLLNLYADFQRMKEVEKVFRRISDKDIVSWNTMIMGYAQTEEDSALSCIELYRELHQTMVLQHDGTTVVAVLKSCQSKSDLQIGLQIHAEIVKSSFCHETIVGNAVINMYSTCGSVEDAHEAFHTMVHKDDISWSSIIGCYERNGIELEALRLCKEMLAAGIQLSCYSLPSCITACSGLAAITLGKQFHSFVIKLGFETDVYVGSSVVDMYAKCGSMEDSIIAFNEQGNPNTVTFNALISGFGQHGKAEEAIKTFEKMEKMNLIPNKITFIAVLSACAHVGLVEKSLHLFELMQHRYRIKPETEHYSCLVDVLGRAGRLEEAHTIMQRNEGDSAWRTLLSACRNYGNTVMGEKTARKVMELNPNDHASYVLLSNLYSRVGRWEEARELRQKMAEFGIKKDPGSSWLINKDWVHEFTAGDFSHPEIENILMELNILYQQIKIVDSAHIC
ncbi:Pentatricopeptide repeat-containing protein [Thalictrum thalictroides]|uniref:Pentatricopeptide repeat-containing protein n=1 Tax=Thalictrum thalictroides TaxID=46969 RepID=A0A7J6VHT8_THATH|nr:Pentatricopeptide repeat-containing protein [Thalictrum thalictroides]